MFSRCYCFDYYTHTPYSLALAAYPMANQKSGDIYCAPCPQSQQHAKGPNEEETIAPHLYAIIHYLLI